MRHYPEEISPLFVVLGCLFVTCLLLSNVIAGKLFVVWGLVLPSGAVLFPVTYIFGDLLTEVYGFRRSRLIIWTGFACNVVMALAFSAVVALPYPEFWKGQGAYAAVLGMTPRLVAASLAAYLLGEFSNAVVMSKMKLLTGGRWLFSRTIGSTLVGEGIDTAIFITGAFYGVVPNAVLFQMVITQYVWKVVYEALATPLTYALVGWVKRKENLDTFDRGVRYNPFGFGV